MKGGVGEGESGRRGEWGNRRKGERGKRRLRTQDALVHRSLSEGGGHKEEVAFKRFPSLLVRRRDSEGGEGPGVR